MCLERFKPRKKRLAKTKRSEYVKEKFVVNRIKCPVKIDVYNINLSTYIKKNKYIIT